MNINDTLNNVTELLNNVADKVTGSNAKQYDTVELQRKGLDELGNIVITSSMESINIDSNKNNTEI